MTLAEMATELTAKNRAMRNHADGLAEVVYDHLENVSAHELRKLKRRLRQFNAKTGVWTDNA